MPNSIRLPALDEKLLSPCRLRILFCWIMLREPVGGKLPFFYLLWLVILRSREMPAIFGSMLGSVPFV